MTAADKEQLAGLKKLREPFPPEQIGKLPKGGITLDFVGHAHLTARLLDIDPLWTWEPMAFDEDGLPKFDKDGCLWIRLTVCGVTRIGVGDAGGKTGGNAKKEAIGDALRNAAMRFGAALELWAKADLSGGYGDRGPRRKSPPETPKRAANQDALDALASVCSKHQYSTEEVAARFAKEHGEDLRRADAEAISTFAKMLIQEATVDPAGDPLADSAEAPDDQEAIF